MVGVGDDLEALAATVSRLAGTDLSACPDGLLAEAFIDLRREVDRLEALAARVLVAVEGRTIPYGEGAVSVAAWAQWRTGQRWADAKASFDAGLACEQLPLTAKAWAQGEISASTARTICRGLRPGHEQVYRQIEDTLVYFAAEHDMAELDGLIGYYRKCCDSLDDREPADRNGLFLSPVGDRSALKGDLDALAGAVVTEALDAAMDPPSDGDTRTPARRRADALVRICRFFLDHEDLPMEGGEAPHVGIVFPWDQIQDWLPCPLVPHDPTSLAALLSGAQRDQLLCDSNIARIILGPHSQPLDVGREQRTAPRSIRRAVAQRDRHCRYPGCDRRPNRCEVHHVIAWQHGGPTTLNNLILLCPFHHHTVHRQGWTNTFNGTTYTIHNADGIDIDDLHHAHRSGQGLTTRRSDAARGSPDG